MKTLISGATGFVGRHLVPRLEAGGHSVRIISRSAEGAVRWTGSGLAEAVAEADAVIHLAGENVVGKRWSKAQKEELRASRVDTTRRLAELCAEHGESKTLISSSAVGYYGPSEATGLDESSPLGDDFLAQLCRNWEEALRPAEKAGVRVAKIRTGVVLGIGGGALAKMLPPFKLGLGGPLGNGKQWVSWIHVDDLCGIFQHVLENDSLSGVFNGTAPEPVTMKGLAKTLGGVLGRPALFPVPGFVLKAALGEGANVLLTGQHVLPKRALEAGYSFEHATLEPALRDLVKK